MHSAAHELLDLRGRNPQPGGVLGPNFRDQRAGDIVAVMRAALYCMARRHPVPVATKQHAGEEARLPSFSAMVVLGGVAGKLGLDRIPGRVIDDWLVFAKVGLLVVNDLAQIEAVLQHQVERTADEWLPTRDAARGARPQLALDAQGFQLALQQPDRAEFGVAAKNEAHDFRLAVDDDELAVLRLITERRHPTHPHPLPLRGGDLVADALADDLALELREGQQNVEGQAPHRSRRVELLRHRDEGRSPRIEALDDLGKIGERAGQSVDLVDDHDIDPPHRDVSEQLLQSRPSHRGAGEPAVIISRGEAHPSFVPLTVDEGLAGFALCLQRIELLFEPLLGRFSRIDRTADGSVPPRCGWWFFHWRPRRLECTRSLAHAKEPWARPMCPGDPLGNHGQRPIPPAFIFEPVPAHEDGMGVSAPLPHQGRAGLQHDAGFERKSAFLGVCRQNPKAALQCAARAAMGSLLQLIGEPPDDQITTEAERRSSVMQCPPSTPQLLC